MNKMNPFKKLPIFQRLFGQALLILTIGYSGYSDASPITYNLNFSASDFGITGFIETDGSTTEDVKLNGAFYPNGDKVIIEDPNDPLYQLQTNYLCECNFLSWNVKVTSSSLSVEFTNLNSLLLTPTLFYLTKDDISIDLKEITATFVENNLFYRNDNSGLFQLLMALNGNQLKIQLVKRVSSETKITSPPIATNVQQNQHLLLGNIATVAEPGTISLLLAGFAFSLIRRSRGLM